MQIVKQKADQHMEDRPNGLDLLSSDKDYFTGSKSICTKVNIVLGEMGYRERNGRLAVVSGLIGRRITSTKQLRFGEALAIWQLRDDIIKELGIQ